MDSVLLYKLYLKKFISLLPILLDFVTGYVVALLFGLVHHTPVQQADWLHLPKFTLPFISYQPQLYWGALLSLAPIAFVTNTTTMGQLLVLNKYTKRHFFKDPGLLTTLAGHDSASILAGFVGGPPVTSYGTNIGVLANTLVHSVYVTPGAGMFALLFALLGKLSDLIRRLPSPVIGGLSFLLFGDIASNGLRVLIHNKVDFDKLRNHNIASTLLDIGLGNASLQFAGYQFSGLALATDIDFFLLFVLPTTAANTTGAELKHLI